MEESEFQPYRCPKFGYAVVQDSGKVTKTMGRYPEAEPLLLKALAIREQHLGTDHPTTAISYNNLARLYKVLGRYSEAEPLFLKALAITEQRWGTDHPDTAISLVNLTAIYYKMQRFAEAKPLITQAVAIFEQSFDSIHSHTVTARRWMDRIEQAMNS